MVNFLACIRAFFFKKKDEHEADDHTKNHGFWGAFGTPETVVFGCPKTTVSMGC